MFRKLLCFLCAVVMIIGVLPASAEVVTDNDLKILAIGNSFSKNSTEYFDEFCKANNVDLILGVLHIDACPIDDHYKNFCGKDVYTEAYEYTKTGQGTKYSRGLDALAEEEWDYVVLQQASKFVGISSSYSRLSTLAETISEKCPSAKIVLNQTWAMEEGCAESWFKTNYKSDQELMFEMLEECYNEAAEELTEVLGYDVTVIPVGEAFQSARKTKGFVFSEGGQSLNANDRRHANDFGKYLAAAMWYQYFTKYEVTQNSFVPNAILENEANILKDVAYKTARKYISVTKPDINKCVFFGLEDKVYTGEKIIPEIVIKNCNTLLVEDKDYTVTVKNNTEIGTAELTIVGKNMYKGTAVKTFNIVGIDVSKCSFTEIPEQFYEGLPLTPSVMLNYNDKMLIENVDYTVSYGNNDEIGLGVVVVSGKGIFTGETTIPFSIKPKNLNFANIEIGSSFEYKGKPVVPEIKIYDGSAYLISGVDYNLIFTNNNAIGKASVKIEGITLEGTISKSFKIYPKKITLKSLKSNSKKTLKVRWKKIKADGYYVCYSTNKNFKKYKFVKVKKNVNNYTLKKLNSKKRYYVKVRAYKKVGKTTYKGNFSKMISLKIK